MPLRILHIKKENRKQANQKKKDEREGERESTHETSKTEGDLKCLPRDFSGQCDPERAPDRAK